MTPETGDWLYPSILSFDPSLSFFWFPFLGVSHSPWCLSFRRLVQLLFLQRVSLDDNVDYWMKVSIPYSSDHFLGSYALAKQHESLARVFHQATHFCSTAKQSGLLRELMYVSSRTGLSRQSLSSIWSVSRPSNLRMHQKNTYRP